MNQGNDRRHAGDDGPWQDEALLVQLPDGWVGIFLAFQSQCWHTDNAPATAQEEQQPADRHALRGYSGRVMAGAGGAADGVGRRLGVRAAGGGAGLRRGRLPGRPGPCCNLVPAAGRRVPAVDRWRAEERPGRARPPHRLGGGGGGVAKWTGGQRRTGPAGAGVGRGGAGRDRSGELFGSRDRNKATWSRRFLPSSRTQAAAGGHEGALFLVRHPRLSR